ncbi:hypothetical protein [Vibrio gazogenes]|uniref:Uncharacterized protein n=1 Tax=Vibrio gazogenes DSM 21264 = NBRC 103151 TaxID=1123492 RepID=A0A1M5C7L7_VIBGA|nr:hypothetical protein [Vibrio gazogenes]USP16304.1 hypothetical protein MKS89_18160 [Vibrio gazogenes]SHF50774.1 hypothetical protein SAMN02745781_02473 [Vibrio gazogenes DSM 21264] [Vibrio gazogenes DSM 21264 = NBRC 103151]
MKNQHSSSSIHAQHEQHEKTKQIWIDTSILILAVLGSSVLAIACLWLDYLYGDHYIGETSVTEYVQQILLGIAVIAFYRIKACHEALRHAAILISGFFMVLFIRELDFLFDYIWHGFWVYPAVLVTLGALAYAWQGKDQVFHEMAEILSVPNMRLLVCSVIILISFSRLFGMGSFWHMVMQEDYIRNVKNIVEEGTELLCYALISYSAVSTQLYVKVRYAAQQHNQINVNKSIYH